MDFAKRSVIRRSITNTIKSINNKLDDVTEIDKVEIISKVEVLNSLEKEMLQLDNQILEQILLNGDEDAANAEQDSAMGYRMEISRIRARSLRVTSRVVNNIQNSQDSQPSINSRQSYKLPKFELQQFDLSPSTWTQFWAQYKRIHEDATLTGEDKLQYLLQCLEKGTKAHKIVLSYPPFNENYENVLQHLTRRFGREELVIEAAIRGIISLMSEKQATSTSDLVDFLSSQIRTLKARGVGSNKYELFLYPMLEKCLPPSLLKRWLQHQGEYTPEGEDEEGDDAASSVSSSSNRKGSKIDCLMRFLEKEVEDSEHVSNVTEKVEQQATAASLTIQATKFSKPTRFECPFCEKSGHSAEKCFKLRKMSTDEVRTALINGKRCLNCTKRNHFAKECKKEIECRKCKGNHHELLCNKPHSSEKKAEQSVSCHVSSDMPTLLQTLIVEVVGSKKNRGRAILDSGSQMTYVTADFARRIGAEEVREITLRQSVFGGAETPPKTFKIVKAKLMGTRDAIYIEAVVTDVISKSIEKIPEELAKEFRETSQEIKFTDVGRGPTHVDMLVGADYYGSLLTGNVMKANPGPVAIETLLGWTILGSQKTDHRTESFLVLNTICLNVATLWELDSLGITDSAGKGRDPQTVAVQHFQENLQIVDGRYQVALPFADGHPEIPEMREVALKRLLSVTNKLKKQGMYATYDESLKEWLRTGIIEEASQEVQGSHYLPHHPVVKQSSETTRVRAVFDGSAKLGSKVSLNDCLLKGPNMIEKIPAVLNRFRCGKFGLTADIKKAFLQISVHPRDRDFLRFLWWKEPDVIQEYRHCRVVFGLTSSPFQLAATIDYHLTQAAQTDESERAVIAEKLKRAFYVDDMATAFKSLEELIQFKESAQKLMEEGSFELTQWKATGDIGTTSILGIQWNTEDDTLSCAAPKDNDLDGVLTKRSLLSCAQSVFDPVGFLAPNLIVVKIIMQEAWKLEVDWDDVLPENIQKRFIAWSKGLTTLEAIKIPRCIGRAITEGANNQLHVFCDASKDAYAACIFLRSEYNGHVEVQLVTAKARVAPMSQISIPRLELIGALIGVRLKNWTTDFWEEEIMTYYWTDSTVVLAWLDKPNDWNAFVSNRVREILASAPRERWQHVPGIMNPADLPSRGCTAQELQESRWWQGPEWLKLTEENWPSTKSNVTFETNEERKTSKKIVLVAASEEIELPPFFKYFSSYTKNVRMVAWIYRFYSKLRKKNTPTGDLKEDEMRWAENRLLKLVQLDLYDTTSATVENEYGLKCTTSRVTNLEQQHLILLPSRHVFVERLIEEEHRKQHAGVLTTLTKLREKFWIIRGRQTVRRVIHRCIRCQRFKAKAASSVVSNLPEDRTNVAGKAFSATGVDCFGPMTTKEGSKVWGVIFTCCTFRAIHLEIISSMSTQCFLLALRRFIARRGRVNTMYSDNGLNFVGVCNLLAAVDWGKIEQTMAAAHIKWIRNPPTASWWGGFFERLIRCVKSVLKTNLGNACLTLEELQTVMCEAESVVNCRPITYVSNEPSELLPLTPAMFLQDNSTGELEEIDHIDREVLCNRVKHRLAVVDHLKQRFREEYLVLLLRRPDGKIRAVNVNDVVLIGSDDKKRQEWPIARVVELYPGKDGECRVARVKTAKGSLIRPIQRLYPLEISLGDLSSQMRIPVTSSDEVLGQDELLLNDSVTDDNGFDVPSPVRSIRSRVGRVIKRPAVLDL